VPERPLRAAVIGLAAAALVCVVAPSAASAAACRGSEEPVGALAVDGTISIRGVRCAEAKQVVARFQRSCFSAYSSQGTCAVRTRRRFSCTSTIVGGPEEGVPSRVTCLAGRRQVRFTVWLQRVAPDGPSSRAQAAGPIGGPVQACGLDTSVPSRLVPPPPPPHDTFEIRAYGLVSPRFAAAVQAELVRRNVAPRLLTGLGVRPRGYPLRAPIYLRVGTNEGVTLQFCGGVPRDGAVVGVTGNIQAAAQTVAHELNHVFHNAIDLSAAGYPWFEDAVGEWSTWKAGWYEPPAGPRIWDVLLQFPDKPVDIVTARDTDYNRYAMWRFVQHLEDAGLWTASDGSWPVARGVSAGGPAWTPTLNTILASQGTSLGQELGAFWGEHLKEKPKRPPRLVPKPGVNSRKELIQAGTKTFLASSCGLCTSLDDFELAEGVRRVEFEFEPPEGGHFWGLVAPNESRRFNKGDTVSFCVGGPNEEDLAWPGHFPVTFTNGVLDHASRLVGPIKIYAQTSTDHCKPPANRACRILVDAGAPSVLGSAFTAPRGHTGIEGGRRYVTCGYTGRAGVGLLQIQRWPSAKRLRAWIRRKHEVGRWPYIHLGDLAIAFSAPDNKHAFVQIAVGRERLSISVSGANGSTSQALRLATGVVRELS
jgi:hypothetical protein